MERLNTLRSSERKDMVCQHAFHARSQSDQGTPDCTLTTAFGAVGNVSVRASAALQQLISDARSKVGLKYRRPNACAANGDCAQLLGRHGTPRSSDWPLVDPGTFHAVAPGLRSRPKALFLPYSKLFIRLASTVCIAGERIADLISSVCINLFQRAVSRTGARGGAANKFASRDFAENCSSDERLRQFCNVPDASRALSNLNSNESTPACGCPCGERRLSFWYRAAPVPRPEAGNKFPQEPGTVLCKPTGLVPSR